MPSQSDGNTLRSNADSVRGDVAPEAGEHEPIAEAERGRLRLQIGQQRTFADDEEARRAAARRTTRAAASTRYELPFDS